MGLFYNRNQEEQRQQFVFILSVICYACAGTGFFRSLTLCWEMGKDNSNFHFAMTLYTFVPSIIMIWSSVLIAVMANNVRKGIVFETSNAQLINWVQWF